jgi:hypothetical protein
VRTHRRAKTRCAGLVGRRRPHRVAVVLSTAWLAAFSAVHAADESSLLISSGDEYWTLEATPVNSNSAGSSIADAILLPAAYAAQEQVPGEPGADLGNSETTLGQAPPENELVFLRRQTVLLAPGEWQFDTGLAYSYFDGDRPIAITGGGGAVVGIDEARVRQRLVAVPLDFRYGWLPGVQLYAGMPVGYSNAEFGFPGFKDTEDDGGIGDFRAGSSIVLCYGQAGDPDVILTTGFTAPSGNGSYVSGGVVPNSQLGEGFWAINANLLFVQTYDPCVVFYGVGYNHRFEDTQQGILVDPGEEVNYQLGVGFAVNSRITLSGALQGAYISEVAVNNDLVEGSTLEPMRMRMAVTMSKHCRIVEPFAEIPMTDDAAARIGVVWTF